MEEYFSIIMSFLTCSSLKVVINDYSFKDQVINSGIPQVSLLRSTIFLLYIYDLPKCILRSFWYIYGIWMHLPKFTWPDLGTDLSFDLSLTPQWRKTGWLYHPHQKDSELSQSRPRSFTNHDELVFPQKQSSNGTRTSR